MPERGKASAAVVDFANVQPESRGRKGNCMSPTACHTGAARFVIHISTVYNPSNILERHHNQSRVSPGTRFD